MTEKLRRQWKKVYPGDLPYIARELKEEVRPGALILLEGPMGAGKTTFAKNFIEDGETLSPSYSVLSETAAVLHGDFYRIKDPEEIYHLELPLYLEDKNYFLLEWGKKFLGAVSRELPEEYSVFQLDIKVNAPRREKEPKEAKPKEAKPKEAKREPGRNFYLYEILAD